jgi:cell division septal protein FtsQ
LVEDYKTKLRIKSVKKRISSINHALRLSIWISLLISSALVLFCALAYISSSQLFHVKNITIKGCSQVPLDEILALLDIEKGDNILACDIDVARQRIEEHPWVQDVGIERRFMPAAILVTIREQIPVAAVYLGDKGYVVNSEGRIFASMPRKFRGLTMRAVGFVPKTSEMQAILKTGIADIHLLEAKGLHITDIEIEAGGRMTFRLSSGISLASLGPISPGRLETALFVIQERQPIAGTVIDLSCDDKVVLSNPTKGGSYGG